MFNRYDIVTAVNNPLRLKSRVKLAKDAIYSWVEEENVYVTVVEVAHGDRDYSLSEDFTPHPRVSLVEVKAKSFAWSKENCINIGISYLPHDAKYIGVFDADIKYRKPGWAEEIIQKHQIYPVLQPWRTCYDLGPDDTHLNVHKSFGGLYHDKKPVLPVQKKFWKHDGGPYDYAHSGFAWSYTRDFLDATGGLFELGGMGSGDYHMATSLINQCEYSIPKGASKSYIDAVKIWQSRAFPAVFGKLGCLNRTIEHSFHGDKKRRGYISRWDMFVKHGFDPYRDLRKNSYGVIEFAGNKPDLEHDFCLYMESRLEDNNYVD